MSSCHHHDPEPEADTPEALWGNARGCWQAFALLFGGPLQLVGEVFIKRTDRNHANAFLRGLEALVRRLLLIEAATLLPTLPARRHPKSRFAPAPPNSDPSHPHPNSAHPRESGDLNQSPPDPYEDRYNTEDQTLWRVSFACRVNRLLSAPEPEPHRAPRTSTRTPRRHLRAPCIDPPSPLDAPAFTFAAPVAARLEALRRVIADPAPFIRRAAHSLRAFRRRNRPPRLCIPPAIPGDNSRFFTLALPYSNTSAARAIDDLWPDTS